MNWLSITKINLLLGTSVVVLSIFTIIWHHQNYLLYKESRVLEHQNQQIIALHRQLLSEHSQQINGFQIKTKALKLLKMRPVLSKNNKMITL